MNYEIRSRAQGLGGVVFFAAALVVSYGLGWKHVTPEAGRSIWTMLSAPSFDSAVRCEGEAFASSVQVTAVSREDAAAYLEESYPGCTHSSVTRDLGD